MRAILSSNFFLHSYVSLIGYFSFCVIVPSNGLLGSEKPSGQFWFLVWFSSGNEILANTQASNPNPWTDSLMYRSFHNENTV